MRGLITTKNYAIYPGGDIYTRDRSRLIGRILNHLNLDYIQSLRKKDHVDYLISLGEDAISAERLKNSMPEEEDESGSLVDHTTTVYDLVKRIQKRIEIRMLKGLEVEFIKHNVTIQIRLGGICKDIYFLELAHGIDDTTIDAYLDEILLKELDRLKK